jgi:SAM-dependent methyltransferase
MSQEPKRVIEQGYDRLGRRFREWVDDGESEAREWFLSEVFARLPDGGDILELGCGAGVEAVTLSAGRRYVGVDLSSVQLGLARARVPGARFIHGDFTSLELPPDSFDAVVALYVFNHVPRGELGATFHRVHTWLRRGGRFMLTLGAGDTPDNTEEDWLGVPMFFSGFGREVNDALLRKAGFVLELSEVREEREADYGVVRWHWAIGRKP